MTQDIRNNLFPALLIELEKYLREVSFQSKRDVLTFPASETDRFGQCLFAKVEKSGFCTLLVTGRTSWNPNAPYFQATRAAAKRGCQIERAFLLPHNLCRNDKTLREHWQLDKDAGIAVKAYYVGDLISTLSLSMGSLDFGIWDDSVCCIAVHETNRSGTGINEWRVTRRAEDLQYRFRMADQIRRAPEVSLGQPGHDEMLNLEEPMITTAPVAHEIASVLCKGDYVSAEDCSWYHSIWQYMRIFDMVSTPTWHSKFYIQGLTELSNKYDFRKILISGTADYSMLAHVLWGYKNSSEAPDITVLDLCETPLFLCKWYAKLYGIGIQTVMSDILTFRNAQPFDLITTDAFLTRFSSAQRLDVINSWHALLRTGGKLVTTVRIAPGTANKVVKATQDQIESFRARALREANKWQGFLNCAPEDIANYAQKYAELMESYPICSEEELRALFVVDKWDMERIEIVSVPGEMISTNYAEIIVSRKKSW